MTQLTAQLTSSRSIVQDPRRLPVTGEELEAAGEHYRNYRVRPADRFERHEDRRGYRWVGGEWRWNSVEWIWTPGHYVRIARW